MSEILFISTVYLTGSSSCQNDSIVLANKSGAGGSHAITLNIQAEVSVIGNIVGYDDVHNTSIINDNR